MTANKASRLVAVVCVTYASLRVVGVVGEARRAGPGWLRPEPARPPRDYRPSKWLANSAMDVWYGNKSFVEILSREFKDVVDKLALRPVRTPLLLRNGLEQQIQTTQQWKQRRSSKTSVTAPREAAATAAAAATATATEYTIDTIQ